MSGSKATAAARDEVLARAASFGREVIEPGCEAWQEAGSVPRGLFAQAADAGLLGLVVPTALGGAGLGAQGYVAVLEQLARHCLATTFALVVHNNLAGAIALAGPASAREGYLAGMLRGEIVGAFLLTEPGAGSDAAAITTTATANADGWRLDGSKAWITNARTADLLCVYAQTREIGDARGIASFLVPANLPGVAQRRPHDIAGARALGVGGFDFSAVALAADALFAPAGTAFANAMRAINLARAGVAGMCCGMLARAIGEALSYTERRRAFGRTIGDFQAVKFLLADCATELEAARALTRAATAVLDAGGDATLACAHAKKFATRVALTRIADCMQVTGAAGLGREFPFARHLAAAKVAQYLDGATEIQNVVIARGLRASYGDAGIDARGGAPDQSSA